MAGTPCTFIRLAGCPLACNYCDTPQAIPLDSGKELSISEIMEQVQANGHALVLVTGGEPLAQRNCTALLQTLVEAGFTTQLETAGAHDIASLPDAVSIIMDIKTPSSGESERNRWQNIEHLQANDEVKLVIGDENDYTWAKRMMTEKGLTKPGTTLLFSPAWQQMDPATLVSWILRDHLPVRLQLQQHKYIWGAERTGV